MYTRLTNTIEITIICISIIIARHSQYFGNVGGGNVTPIGYEMVKADEQKRPQPNVAPHNDTEEPLLGKIKDIIAQMATFQPSDRISAKEVKAQLTELQVENIGVCNKHAKRNLAMKYLFRAAIQRIC